MAGDPGAFTSPPVLSTSVVGFVFGTAGVCLVDARIIGDDEADPPTTCPSLPRGLSLWISFSLLHVSAASWGQPFTTASWGRPLTAEARNGVENEEKYVPSQTGIVVGEIEGTIRRMRNSNFRVSPHSTLNKHE